MKKVLAAVGLIAASTGAVQAQSSVTVYGIIDAGYVGGNSRVVNPITGIQTKSTVNQFGQNAESSSRLGFKGNEDLGGGTSAFLPLKFNSTRRIQSFLALQTTDFLIAKHLLD